MAIKFFKLKNGEEFVAEVVADQSKHITIRQPVVLVVGDSSANFVLWCPLRKERDFDINHSEIMFEGTIDKEVENEYNQLFNPSAIIKPMTSPVPPGVASVRPNVNGSSIITG